MTRTKLHTVREYRNDIYEFFDRRDGGTVGVRAYRFSSFWSIIRDYLEKQEKLDLIYGVCGLVSLVPEEMAMRFDSALTKFNIAIRRCPANDKTKWGELKQRAEICKRGLDAMEAYVKQHKLFTSPNVLVSERDDGKVFAVVLDDEARNLIKETREDIYAVWTLEEVMKLIDNYRSVSDIKNRLDKKGIKETKVESISNPENEDYYNDEVPF